MSNGAAAIQRNYSLEDYWAEEAVSASRFEYYRGAILAMAGGSERHAAIISNLGAAVANRVRGTPCRSLSTDMRIYAPGGLYTYADWSIFCVPPVLTADPLPTATNPTVLFEVLSKSTRDYDRGQRRELYQDIPSVTDIVLVGQSEMTVEHWYRSGDRFEMRVLRGAEACIGLTGCAVTLPLAEIYERALDLPG
jgi:Uma2 family endonuclease